MADLTGRVQRLYQGMLPGGRYRSPTIPDFGNQEHNTQTQTVGADQILAALPF